MHLEISYNNIMLTAYNLLIFIKGHVGLELMLHLMLQAPVSQDTSQVRQMQSPFS
jgi:hypothetical protein